MVNAGDSRCYLFHHGELSQTTHDHTLGEDLIRLGMSPLIQSDRLVGRHWITNAIGGPDPGVRVEVHKLTLEPGDVLLLATDGLTNELTDEVIAAILATEPDPRTTCERLVAKALSQGGRDNVTVIVAKFEAGANSV